MPLPSVIQRLYSFTGFQQAQGDNAFPGTQVDSDLDQTNNALNSLLSAFSGTFREDGKLANGVVGRNALAADIRIGFGPSRPWVTGTTYAKDETVTVGYSLYQANSAHTAAAAFATDLAAGRWVLVADLSQAVVIADNGISTAKLVDKAATEPKLGDGAASTRVLADGAVTRAKAAVNLGVIPVGGEIDYAGITPPAGWLWANGQAVSRTTYAELFGALSYVVTGNSATGSDTLTGLSANLVGIGLVGARIEGPGVQPGSIVAFAAGTEVILSAPLTATGTGGTYRILPYGNGDGTTTFFLPDRRGRVTAGRDDMGGAAAGRLVAPFVAGDRLNGVGGAQSVVLSLGQLPTFTPTGTVFAAGAHGHTFVYQRSENGYAGGGGIGGIVSIGDENVDTASQFVSGVADHTHVFGGNPIGNGEPHANIQPTGIANRIIFAGV